MMPLVLAALARKDLLHEQNSQIPIRFMDAQNDLGLCLSLKLMDTPESCFHLVSNWRHILQVGSIVSETFSKMNDNLKGKNLLLDSFL